MQRANVPPFRCTVTSCSKVMIGKRGLGRRLQSALIELPLPTVPPDSSRLRTLS